MDSVTALNALSRSGSVDATRRSFLPFGVRGLKPTATVRDHYVVKISYRHAVGGKSPLFRSMPSDLLQRIEIYNALTTRWARL